MRIHFVIIAVSLLAINFALQAAEVTIEPDRMLRVDGERTFIVGLYENPKDDAVLVSVAEAGFNLVHAAAHAESLDRLRAHGLWAWVNTGMAIDLDRDAAAHRAQLDTLAQTTGAHPALLCYEVPDEALWNCWYGPIRVRHHEEPGHQRALIREITDADKRARLEAMRDQADARFDRMEWQDGEALADAIWRELGQDPPHPELSVANAKAESERLLRGMLDGYAYLRQRDPEHPIWMNHAPRNTMEALTAYGRAADIVGCDIYPAPAYKTGHSDLADRSLSSVGAYTRRMQASAPGKPVFMVLQGFGWPDLDPNASDERRRESPRPSWKETRFMAYDAIVRGARGILYWGTAYLERDSTLWADLLRLAKELDELQPVLSAPDAADAIEVRVADTWGSVDRGPVALAKNADGKIWVIVANEWHEPLRYTLAGLPQKPYHDPTSGEPFEPGAEPSIVIPGNGVHIWAPR